jgi:hypothetical protein
MKNDYKLGVTYLSDQPDLVRAFDGGHKGPFEVIFNGNVYDCNVDDVPGHSPVITSLIPTGTRNYWLITKKEPTSALETAAEKAATVGARR